MLLAQVNPEAERIMGLTVVIIALGGCCIVLFFAFRAFIRSQKSERERAAKHTMQLHNATSRLQQLYLQLVNSPDDASVHAELRQIVSTFPSFAAEVYVRALDAIESSKGAASTKRFALEMGRVSHSLNRPKGVPTSYDEQAIRNDISARVDSM